VTVFDQITQAGKEDAAAHEAEWGNFNDPPPGLREITAAEFAQSSFFVFPPVWVEYRQITRGDVYKGPIKLFGLSNGTWFGIANDYWAKTVRYFAFGCAHTYAELTPEQARQIGHSHFGGCYHVLRCTRCEHVTSYDSGD
jgi:hypothetical protein